MAVDARRMSLDDYDDLVALWKAAGLEHRPDGRDSRASVARDLARPGNLFLMAWDGDLAVGSVLCTEDGRKGWINRLAVRPSHQRRGIATMLVEAAEEHFNSLGIGVYAIIVHRGNASSLALFHALGYENHEEMIYLSKRTGPGA
jgi:ribosomal protein S18 acetylase RimI-like enzyme